MDFSISSPQVFAINDLGRGPAGVKTFTLREGLFVYC